MGQEYVYFLQFRKQLPRGYFALAEGLSGFGITLVAMAPGDFLAIRDSGRRFVVGLADDLSAQAAFLECKKHFIDFGINAGNLVFFHFTSFGELPPSAGTGARRSNGQYHHLPLPMDVAEACKQVALVYYREKASHQAWPGGRRPKLQLGDLAKNG